MVQQEQQRLRIGVQTRTSERTMDGTRQGFTELKTLALAAEATGCDSFWLPDHLTFRPHEPEQLGCWEVFTVLSALASVTTTLHLGTLVAATSFRNPALLAKIATTLDDVSGGRFILGLGAGNWAAEHTLFGYPFDHQVSRFAEALQIIGPLLRDGAVDFQGQYYHAPNCVLAPRGPSPTGPAIWIGGRGDRIVRLAAQHADAFNTIWPTTVEQVAAQRARLLAACATVGRDPASIALTVGTFVHFPTTDQPEPAPNEIGGTPAQIAARLRAFADLGVSHLVVDLRPEITLASLAQFGAVLRLLRE